MLERFKEWYYKYGVLACRFDKDVEAALKAIKENGGDILPENSFRYKLMHKAFIGNNIIIKALAKKVFVYKAANRSEAFRIADDYIKYSNGYYINQNVNRPEY